MSKLIEKLENLQQQLKEEKDEIKIKSLNEEIASLQAQIDNKSQGDLPEDKAPTSKEEAPKSLLEQAKEGVITAIKTGSKVIVGNAIANYLNVALSNGTNPSAKYLKQKIITKGLPEKIAKWLSALTPNYDFTPNAQGKGVEYILTELGTVCSMDEDAFVPDEVWLQENHTHIDTLDIPTPGKNAYTWAVERSSRPWKYVHYFLSGKENELINQLRNYSNQSFALMVFKKTYELVKTAYDLISSGNGDNYLKGSATSCVDALEEFRNFIEKMLDSNVAYNFGSIVNGSLVPFNSASNFISSFSKMKMITTIETYNGIKKYLPFVFNSGALKEYITNLDNWVLVPNTYLNVDATKKTVNNETVPNTSINGQPSVDALPLFYKTVDNETVRQKGTIMILAGDNESIKIGSNYSQEASDYYPKNDTTQYFNKKNINTKLLKWSQIAVFENEHLEDPFAIPVSQLSQSTTR